MNGTFTVVSRGSRGRVVAPACYQPTSSYGWRGSGLGSGSGSQTPALLPLSPPADLLGGVAVRASGSITTARRSPSGWQQAQHHTRHQTSEPAGCTRRRPRAAPRPRASPTCGRRDGRRGLVRRKGWWAREWRRTSPKAVTVAPRQQASRTQILSSPLNPTANCRSKDLARRPREARWRISPLSAAVRLEV